MYDQALADCERDLAAAEAARDEWREKFNSARELAWKLEGERNAEADRVADLKAEAQHIIAARDAAEAERDEWKQDAEDFSAIDALGEARAQRDRLAAALREMTEGAVQNVIRGFHEKGHPGFPAIRSGWVRVEMHARAAADITAAREALSVLDTP